MDASQPQGKKQRRRQTLFGQFLLPVLFAVIAVGITVAFVSRWYADRVNERASIDRMRSIGGLIVNAPFRLTPSVLNQIQQMTQFDLALVSFPSDASPSVLASTSNLPDGLMQELRVFQPGVPASEIILLGKKKNEAHLATYVSAGPNHLVVLESIRRSSFLGSSFWLPLITGLISAIGIGIVATWTASRLTRRIGVLKAEVEEIATGKVIVAPVIGPSDDLQLLQHAIHKMSHELGESKKQIAANERSRLIQLMASGLVHELRNHMTGAKLALQTCSDQSSDAEAIAIATQQMDLAERQLRRLLSVQAGSDPCQESAAKSKEILVTVVDLIRPMTEHQGVGLDVFPPLSSSDPIDARLFDTLVPSGNSIVGALLNLLINAIEAAGPNGRVQLEMKLTCPMVASAASSSRVTFLIRDNGLGPSPKVAAMLFEPFVTTKPEGVGLGLAMCQRVVHSLGGDISWRRETDWTVFELCIPSASMI